MNSSPVYVSNQISLFEIKFDSILRFRILCFCPTCHTLLKADRMSRRTMSIFFLNLRIYSVSVCQNVASVVLTPLLSEPMLTWIVTVC